MRELTSKNKIKSSSIDVINSYISDSKLVINITQNAINNPTTKNFEIAERFYGNWVLDTYKVLKKVNEKSADDFLSEPDMVRVHTLNSLEQRLNNTVPIVTFFKDEDGLIYADESGIRMLQNIISSVKEKVSFLRVVNLELKNKLRPVKNNKKVILTLSNIGLKNELNKKVYPVKGKREQYLELLHTHGPLSGEELMSKLDQKEGNLSVGISQFNIIAKRRLGIKENVIDSNNKVGYFLNKSFTVKVLK